MCLPGSKYCIGGISNNKKAHAGWDTREEGVTRKPWSGMMKDGAYEAEKELTRSRQGPQRLMGKGSAQSLILRKKKAFSTAKILCSI